MANKSIWGKITGLKEEELEKEKEEIELPEEEEKGKIVEIVPTKVEDSRSTEEEIGKKIKKREEKMSLEEEWLKDEYEAQLSVDLYQDEKNIFIKSVIGGVEKKDLKIDIEKDIITIRGERKMLEKPPQEYLHQECYWGKFSRTIVLPSEIEIEKAKIKFKNGILTIVLPKK